MISTSPSRAGEPVTLSTWDDLALMYAIQRGDERALWAIYVTVEPEGGSAAPTTEAFLRGVVPSTY